MRSVSKRLGITSRDVLKKAAEFQRLMEVRGCSLALTSLAKPVICLEIAAHSLQVPVYKVGFFCAIIFNFNMYQSNRSFNIPPGATPRSFEFLEN